MEGYGNVEDNILLGKCQFFHEMDFTQIRIIRKNPCIEGQEYTFFLAKYQLLIRLKLCRLPFCRGVVQKKFSLLDKNSLCRRIRKSFPSAKLSIVKKYSILIYRIKSF